MFHIPRPGDQVQKRVLPQLSSRQHPQLLQGLRDFGVWVAVIIPRPQDQMEPLEAARRTFLLLAGAEENSDPADSVHRRQGH